MPETIRLEGKIPPALAGRRLDQALAELEDAQAICAQWLPAWIFKLRARAYSKRGRPGDIELSADNLERYIQASVQYGGALDWSDVRPRRGAPVAR